MDYATFLSRKSHADDLFGFDATWVPKMLFDFQSSLVKWSIRKGRAALLEDCGLGKGQPYGSKILTLDGWKKIENMKVGDYVFGSDGKPAEVTGVHHKDVLPCYKIGFSDGSSFVCDIDHLHILRTNNDRQRGRSWRVLSTKWLLKQNLWYGKSRGSRNFDIPVTEPIQFEKKYQPIPAYTLGVLLGDGCLMTASISFTSADKEIVERVREEVTPIGLRVVEIKYSQYGWRISGRATHRGNPILSSLKRMELMGKYSYEKTIPKAYLFGSVEQRIELLRGLMDTDGYVEKGGCCQFGSSSEKLAKQVTFLVRSLGGCPTVSQKETGYKGKDGKRIECRTSHLVTFSLKGINPFYLSRKADRWNPTPRDNGRWIDSIEPVGDLRTVCLSVNSKDHSYITKNCIVTHNSFQEIVFAENVLRKENKPVLILTPLAVAPQMVREGEKLGVKIHNARDGRVKKGINVVNYQKLHLFNPTDFAGVIADESSAIKHDSSATRKAVTAFLAKVKYRLLATATPAPNDYMELGTSSEALGAMGRNQMLGMFFTNQGKDKKTGHSSTQQWDLKGHARRCFWRWVCTWARAIRKPSDLGFSDEGFILPLFTTNQHVVASPRPARGFGKFATAKTLDDQRAERKATIHERCEKVAELVAKRNDYSLCYCHLNAEGDLLADLIPGAVNVQGSDRDEVKEEMLDAFANGQIKVLVTKSKIGGWGLNLQHCNHVVTFPSFSFEGYYQSIRRCWRFGQKRPVTSDIVYSMAEGRVFDAMRDKERQMDAMFDGLVAEMHAFQSEKKKEETHKKPMTLPPWLLNGKG